MKSRRRICQTRCSVKIAYRGIGRIGTGRTPIVFCGAEGGFWPILLQKSGLDGPPRRDFEVGSRPLVAARSDEGGDAPVPTLTTPHEHAAPNATFT
jgi:hypothetical protein